MPVQLNCLSIVWCMLVHRILTSWNWTMDNPGLSLPFLSFQESLPTILWNRRSRPKREHSSDASRWVAMMAACRMFKIATCSTILTVVSYTCICVCQFINHRTPSKYRTVIPTSAGRETHYGCKERPYIAPGL